MSGRLVTDPDRMIAEFDLYRVGDRWRAVYRRDPEIVFENDNWGLLWLDCWAKRITMAWLPEYRTGSEAGSGS